MAESKSSGPEHRKANEKADGDPAEAANSGDTKQEQPAGTGQETRRVPGLHGYDPSQWPDTAT